MRERRYREPQSTHTSNGNHSTTANTSPPPQSPPGPEQGSRRSRHPRGGGTGRDRRQGSTRKPVTGNGGSNPSKSSNSNTGTSTTAGGSKVNDKGKGPELMPADMMAATDRQPLPEEDDVLHFDPSLDDKLWHTTAFTSLAPSGRRSVTRLSQWLDWAIRNKVDIKGQQPMDVVKGVQLMYSVCFRELIRQISIECSERGLLLAKIWWKYVQLFKRVLEHSEEEKVRVMAVLEERHRDKLKQMQEEYEQNIRNSHENFLQKLELLGESKEGLAQELQNLQRELIRRQNELEIYNRKHVYLQKDLYNLKLRVKRSEERCAEFETCRSFLLSGLDSGEGKVPLVLKPGLNARDRLSAITLLVSDVQDRISSLPFGVKDGIFKTLMKEVRLHFEREVPNALKDEFRGQRFDSLLGLEGMLLAMEKHLTSEEQWLLKQIKDTGVNIDDPETGVSVADLGPEDLSLEQTEEGLRKQKHTLIQASTTDTVDVHEHMKVIEKEKGFEGEEEDTPAPTGGGGSTAPEAEGLAIPGLAAAEEAEASKHTARGVAQSSLDSARQRSQTVVKQMSQPGPLAEGEKKAGEGGEGEGEGEGKGEGESDVAAHDEETLNRADTVATAFQNDINPRDPQDPGPEPTARVGSAGVKFDLPEGESVQMQGEAGAGAATEGDGGVGGGGETSISRGSSRGKLGTLGKTKSLKLLLDEEDAEKEEYVVFEDKSTQTDFSRDEYYPPALDESGIRAQDLAAQSGGFAGDLSVTSTVSTTATKKKKKGKDHRTRAAIEEENRQNRIKAKSKRKKKQVTIYNRHFSRILSKVNTDISSFRTRSRKIILKLIGQIYTEKMASDAVDDTTGAARTSMPEFVYTYHLFKYGLRQLAEKFLVDFLLNILAARGQSQRVATFASFCGIGSETAGSDALDLYLYSISCLKNALGATFLDTEDEEWLISGPTANETARFIFHYYDDMSMARLLGKISELARESSSRIDGDAFLQVLMDEWTSKGEDAPGGLVALFLAADYNNDGLLNFEEFRSLVEHVSKDRSPMEIARMYRESLDSTDAYDDMETDGISLQAFLVMAKDNGLASWKAQAALPAQPGIGQSQMFDLLESTWETTQSWVEEQLKVLGAPGTKLPPEVAARLQQKRSAFIGLLKGKSEINAAWHSYRMLMEDIHSAVKDYYSVGPGKAFLPEGYSKLF